VSPDKITVVYNGIDNGSFGRAGESGNSSGAPDRHSNGSFVFAHVGQFVPWKNHIVFLKAASHIAADLSDARFVLVGDDIFGRNSAYKRSVLSHARNSPIAEKIDFLGWQENMHEVWPKINCLVHTAEREPFGRVIIEAMAHRIPVIAAGSCGPSEIIQDRETGILVQADDVESLSAAMLNIARDSQFAGWLAKAGYEHATSSFTADKTAAQIQEVYAELLAG
jgi:glycosyltransferase involved in cell wall biosynthesis